MRYYFVDPQFDNNVTSVKWFIKDAKENIEVVNNGVASEYLSEALFSLDIAESIVNTF